MLFCSKNGISPCAWSYKAKCPCPKAAPDQELLGVLLLSWLLTLLQASGSQMLSPKTGLKALAHKVQGALKSYAYSGFNMSICIVIAKDSSWQGETLSGPPRGILSSCQGSFFAKAALAQIGNLIRFHTGDWSTEQKAAFQARNPSWHKEIEEIMQNSALLVCFLQPGTVTKHLMKVLTFIKSRWPLHVEKSARQVFSKLWL